MTNGSNPPIRVADFVAQLHASTEEILSAFYWLVRQDPALDEIAIINPPCSSAELDGAEERVNHRLHPLHRLLLSCSNGGTIPFVSISLLAAAIPREQEWRIVGPLRTIEETRHHVFTRRLVQPIPPMLLGASLREEFGDAAADLFRLDELISFAAGYGGERWAYTQRHPTKVLAFQSYGGTDGYCDSESEHFGEFIGEQILYPDCATPRFAARVRAAMRNV